MTRVFACAAALLAWLATVAGPATGQPSLKQALVGTWTFVSSTSVGLDGKPAWDSHAKGLLIFTENGHFSQQIMRGDRPHYKSGIRLRASLIENQATTRGTLSYFGSYDVNEADKTLTYHIVSSSFPNFNGTDQRRVVHIVGDELRYQNPAPTRGGPPTMITWRRAR